jgi:hypothetical protein
MRLPASILAILLAILITSCGGSSTSTETKVNEVEDTIVIQPLYLEGLYATSTRLPHHEFGIENLFDGKAGTIWSTTVGAGPDEGFILYFPTAQYVKEMYLDSLADMTNIARVKGVTVYADGHSLGYFDPAGLIRVDKDVRSLFVKIGETSQSSFDDVTEEGGDETLSMERFNEQYAVGFSGIRLIGKEGVLPLTPPMSVRGDVKASSVLQPASAYGESQLFDSRKEFVWAEGAKSGGEGESLTFTFEEEQSLTAIRIWNGYQRSEKHFESNARIKSFEIGVKDGTKTKYSIEDSTEPQTVNFASPMKGKVVVLTVLEVYPGTSYKDLVVSELLFFNEARPILIHDNGAESRVEALLTEIKGSVLEDYLDRRLHNQRQASYYTSDRSLVLRSNKTFVLYDHTSSQDESRQDDKEVVADGNWEIMEMNEKYAKIRVFGKLFNISETVEYYKGNTSTEFVKIFQDVVHITPEEIKGEKYVDSFHHQWPAEYESQ